MKLTYRANYGSRPMSKTMKEKLSPGDKSLREERSIRVDPPLITNFINLN